MIIRFGLSIKHFMHCAYVLREKVSCEAINVAYEGN